MFPSFNNFYLMIFQITKMYYSFELRYTSINEPTRETTEIIKAIIGSIIFLSLQHLLDPDHRNRYIAF